jgi:hypothetical protein
VRAPWADVTAGDTTWLVGVPDEVMHYFEAVRSSYTRTLEHAIRAEVSKNPDARVYEEVVARTGDSSYKTCWDIAIEHGDGRMEPVLVDLHAFLPWEPARFRVGNLSVLVEPFLWHVCSIVARPAPAEHDFAALADWFDRWFERAKQPSERFRNAVHWMSDPELKAGHLCLQVDLGSAPPDALLDLLRAIDAMAASSAAIYTSPDYATPDLSLP